MSGAITAVVISAIGTGYSVHSGEQAKKSAKHAKERAAGRAREISDAEAGEARKAKAGARSDRLKRLQGYERNLGIFGGSNDIAGKAASARKTLLGE